MSVIVNSERRRRSCQDRIWDGTAYVVDTYLPKFWAWFLDVYFEGVIWLLSYLYDAIYETSFPTKRMAPSPYYGKFICPSCKHDWISHQCKPNNGQQCKKCFIDVHPYEQRFLRPWDRFANNNLADPRSSSALFIVMIFVLFLLMIIG